MSPAAVIRFAVIGFVLLLIFGSIGLTAGLYSVLHTKPPEFAMRLPEVKSAAEAKPYIPIKGTLTSGNTVTGTHDSTAADWSNFRGENYDAISAEKTPLRKDWSDDRKPPELWGLPLGEGFAGAAVRNGRVYILDYDMENFRDALRCLSLDTGKELWRYSYPVKVKKNHGMSRTVPAVTDQYCVSLGPKCHVLCVNAVTGEEKWFLDLQHDYGTAEPEWYAGQCPMIAIIKGKPAAILAPAGPDALMIAADCETGKEIWRTPNPFGWTMTHASIAPMTLDDRQTFVYFGKGGVVGVDAADGKILWSTTEWQIEIATCPSPVILPENRIFCCGGYLSGSVMLQIKKQQNTSGGTLSAVYTAVPLWRLKDAVFGSEQQTPIFYGGHLFGTRQRDKQFVCLDLSGNVVWSSGSKERFGSGPYISADGMFLILDDDGKLTGCEATAAGFRKLFGVQILDDHGCWAPMALTGGRLLLRDQVFMKCIDLRVR